MLTGRATRLAHRPHHLGRNEQEVRKMWGEKTWREGDVCAAWAFTRRANGVTQDRAKVAGGTFLEGAERRWRSGGCAFAENLRPAYVAALAVVRLVSILTRALSTGTGAVLAWGEEGGREVTWKADALYNRSPELCQDIYLTDGADATQRAGAEGVLVVFTWEHFTLQTVAVNGALWQHELMSFRLILQWFLKFKNSLAAVFHWSVSFLVSNRYFFFLPNWASQSWKTANDGRNHILHILNSSLQYLTAWLPQQQLPPKCRGFSQQNFMTQWSVPPEDLFGLDWADHSVLSLITLCLKMILGFFLALQIAALQ